MTEPKTMHRAIVGMLQDPRPSVVWLAAELGLPEIPDAETAPWRYARFRDLGFDLFQAGELAATRSADYREAERLLDHGCDRETAFELLRA
jgi:hypothetical protein